MNLEQFLDQLDSFTGSVPLSQLQVMLGQLDWSPGDESDWMFDSEKYQRNLLRRSPHYEALLLCFEAGQRTPIHDHAGSACGVRVMRGEGIETTFRQTDDGWLYATGSAPLNEGGVTGSVDMDIHQLSNLQTGGKRLMTLHIYSPPLGEVGNYCIEDNSVKRVTADTQNAAV